VSFVAICWNLDTTLLTTRNTVLSSSVEVGSGVWGGTLVDKVERAVGLALFYLACLSEKPRVDTRLARDPRIGDGNRSLEKDKRKGMHYEEVVSKCSEVIYSRWLESMIFFGRLRLLLITFLPSSPIFNFLFLDHRDVKRDRGNFLARRQVVYLRQQVSNILYSRLAETWLAPWLYNV
jgi:hypothetical protein